MSSYGSGLASIACTTQKLHDDLRRPLLFKTGGSFDFHYPPSTNHYPLSYPSHPTANRNAAQTSFIRAPLNCATRFPKRACETVTVLCRFTAHGDFIPSSTAKATSEGTPRMVVVIGATVTVARYSIALFRVSTTTGRLLSGASKVVEADIAARYSSGHAASASHSKASSRPIGARAYPRRSRSSSPRTSSRFRCSRSASRTSAERFRLVCRAARSVAFRSSLPARSVSFPYVDYTPH